MSYKYLDNIKGDDSDFDLNELTVYEKKRVVENLPLKVNNKILEFIGSVTEYGNQYITFKDDTVVEFDIPGSLGIIYNHKTWLINKGIRCYPFMDAKTYLSEVEHEYYPHVSAWYGFPSRVVML